MSKQQLSVVDTPVIDPAPDAAADPASGAGVCCSPLACAPLGAEEAAELAPLFKAIGDPVRLRLLSLIACHEGGEACVCELTDAFDLTPPTISHHLKVLKQAGLIDSERRGTWVYYWVNPQVLQRLSVILGPRVAAVASQ
ncbi:transcriptional regulator [Actinomadura sp. NBRC 104425]|uniref:ArsR/SmtB family transcription factor n=1 Tax=Actinomadura sp. NBRC 104425 TaxID=3032204 RepID=UPI0024A1AC29|nr:metalloregulator ArsR/SmtB family transcription factor [Actinomadura sp. NBRC 104425]GLZ15764.1 transcriptional regulator [Actinomadura sp. NBRC 104425]